MTYSDTKEEHKSAYMATGNPFDLIGYDNPYDAQTLFPAFKVMIDMAHEEVLNQIDDDAGEILEEALMEALKSHRELFTTAPGCSREHYANNFILSFFQGHELPDMGMETFRVFLAALSPFMGKPKVYNV